MSALLVDKVKIYLDTKYWLILRDQNNETDPNKRILLDKILELSDSGKCIFPISEISFWEFLKQKDLETLKMTTFLVDRLSKGVSMINVDERRVLEFKHFLYNSTERETHDLSELIWTKLSLILGYDFIARLETEDSQKSFFDFVTNASLSDVILTLYHDGEIAKPFSYKDDRDALNKGKFDHEDENTSFKQMFLSELGGYLEFYRDVFKDVVYDMFCRENNKEAKAKEKKSVDNTYMHLIYNGFKKEKLTTELPVFRVVPELFASARRNKDRRFSDGNDLLDFIHASFALPYCDYFFTEDELKTMIEQTKLDKLYGCVVESKPKLILGRLNKME
jgi:hypothetical protein